VYSLCVQQFAHQISKQIVTGNINYSGGVLKRDPIKQSDVLALLAAIKHSFFLLDHFTLNDLGHLSRDVPRPML